MLDLIRLPHIAEMCGLTKGTVYQMHFAGKLPAPAYDDGVVKLWWRDDIIAWNEQRPRVTSHT